MNTGLGLIIMAEVAVTLFLIWGFAHEEIFVALESKVLSKFISKRAKSRLRLIIGKKEKGGNKAA